jgi:4-coumarate--CoA ligase
LVLSCHILKNSFYSRFGEIRGEILLSEFCMLGLIPWFHAFGFLTLFNILLDAVRVVFIPKFEEGLFLSCIENYRINFIFMVPPLMVFLAKHPMVDSYDLSSIKVLFSGAAPLSKEVTEAVKTRLPHVKTILQGYGMSEMTLGVVLQTPNKPIKSGSVGSLIRGMYAKVIDPDTGKTLGPNQRGELCFKGSQVMKGYIGNEKETKNTIDSEGYLHTGDVGYFDEDQQFFIVDRLKELIKYKAFQVPPAELEAILLENPKVKDAAVIGMPDDASGELPLAFVVRQDGVSVTAKEIVDYVAARTSPAKRLHGGVRFVEAIPKNPSGKILRRDLRSLLASEKPKSKL